MSQLDFDIAGVRRTEPLDSLIIAGWTGRDAAAVEHHIAELVAIGVTRPPAVPCFYRLGANLLTHAPVIQLSGSDSSGEVEVVLLSLADGLHVGVGSDHTDRKVETYDVTVSKQMCPKPVSRELWRLSEVESHWDELMLRSWVTRHGRRELYQEGSASRMLAPPDLMARYLGSPGVLPVGTAMYCGTLPVNGEIGGGEHFEVELVDPRSTRRLQHAYAAHYLAGADEGSLNANPQGT